jgi:hypothetical protein
VAVKNQTDICDGLRSSDCVAFVFSAIRRFALSRLIRILAPPKKIKREGTKARRKRNSFSDQHHRVDHSPGM